MSKGAKADLHVHSKYSDRPSEWFLRRIGAPESFVEPKALYEACRNRGMDFVTISDHNCIRGALEIADLPGTFISSELTTYFPENGCKIHCLVSGINEAVFPELQEARENIYDLHAVLNEKGIVHTIAHPLYSINDRLTIDLFEKLLLMFPRFEVINGSRDPRAGNLLKVILENLTPGIMKQLAEKHEMEPTGAAPWEKRMTAGSDDHSGLYSAGAYTVTPGCSTVFDFLHYLKEGRHECGGRAGTSLRLAHSLYGIAFSYYMNRFKKGDGASGDVLGAMLKRLAGMSPPPQDRSTFTQTIFKPFSKYVVERKKKKLNDIERLLVEEFSVLRERLNETSDAGAQKVDQDRMNFETACNIGHQLCYSFAKRTVEQMKKGHLIGSLQSLSSMGPVLLGLAPYLTAFGTQHKDEKFLQSVAGHFDAARGQVQKSGKRIWVTDTYDDVNGVAHTIRCLARLAYEQGNPITVATCLPETPSVPFPLKNFEPVGEFAFKEYEGQSFVFPPFLDLLEFIEREEFDEIVISTPGPMGLAAMAAGKLLKVKMTGIYHTDFPRYISHLTQDDSLEDVTWRYMSWFYDAMERVYAPSQHYMKQLIERGFEEDKVCVLTRGVDHELYNPSRRESGYWNQFGANGAFKFMYAGRISREKNLEVLLQAFLQYRQDNSGEADLVLVGDGPYMDELKSRYQDKHILFVGFLKGERLASAYASADVFVFPSMTDTFGNAVLEAHASGLPAIVSDRGGPAEIVQSHHSGLIVNAQTPEHLANAMKRLYDDTQLRQKLREGALARANESRWEVALNQF